MPSPDLLVLRAPLAVRVGALARVAVLGGWLGFVWLTTHWYSWQRTIQLLFGSDMREYERVARAAPGFPAEPLPSQHAARFVPHYAVGLVSDALDLGDRDVYYAAAILLLLAIVVVVDRLIAPLRLSLPAYAVCTGALIANPYLFRFLAICPARLADSVFVLGGCLALLGLFRASTPLLVGGLVLATLGRSEAVLPLALLAPVGVWLSPEWRRRPRRLAAVLAFAAPAAAYGIVRAIDASFSVADHPGFMGLTIFGALAHLPSTAHEIGGQLARTLVGVAGAVGILVGIAIAARALRRRVPFAAWAALAAGAAVSLEAVVLNPVWLNGSEPLLAALGTAFLVVAAAVLISSTGIRVTPTAAAVATAGLALTSLHHRFSEVSPVSSPAAYAGLAVTGLVVAAAALAGAASGRARPRRRSAG